MLARFSEKDIETRFTQAAKGAIAFAKEESCRLGHKTVCIRQLLLGLLAGETDLAAQILKSKGVTLQKARHEIGRILDNFDGASGDEDNGVSFSPEAEQSLSLALKAALEMGHSTIGTGHLLLGLICHGHYEDGGAVWVLENLGVNLRNLEQQIREHLRDIELAMLNQIRWSAGWADPCSYYPSDMVAGEIAARLTARLVSWVDAYELGRVFSTNTGLRLPNQDIHALGISFISSARLDYSSRNYMNLAPDLVIEIKSRGESMLSIQASIQQCLALGTYVGILVDPDERTVITYRPNNDVAVLTSRELLTIPELLPDWKILVSQIWSSH